MATKERSNYFIIAAVVLLVLVIYRLKTKGSLMPDSAPPQEVSQTQTPSSGSQVLEKDDLTRVKSQEQDKKRVNLAAKERLGMQSMPLRVKDGKFELPFELAIKPLWCQSGEYESVLSLVRDLDKKLFLISLENAKTSKNLAKPLRVSLSDLARGFRHTFKLPGVRADTNENVNLMICTDREKKGHCGNLKPADYPRLEALQQKKPDHPLKDDYIYMFHNLFIKDGELVAHGSMDYSNDYKNRVVSILKKESFEMSVFNKTWGMAETTRSEPPTLGPGRFTAYLSRNNPKCRMR